MTVTRSALLSLLLLAASECVVAEYARMKGYSLQEYPNASCLDGTPGMYYHFPGNSNSNKWYIEMQGGGWCGDFEHCIRRSLKAWGSSSAWPAYWTTKTPFFSTDSVENPLMHDWNRVYFRYCDGFSFSGNVSEPVEHNGMVLHLRGNDILEAGIDDMLFKRNLANATDVVVGGCSAGGLSTIWKCDHWAKRIRQHSPQVKVGCAPDSGFFVNYNGTPGRPTYQDLMMDGLEFHRPVLPSSCIENEHASPSNCVFAEHVVKYMETPIFVMQPVYDSWARGAIRLSNGDQDEINQFGDLVTTTILNNVLADAVSSEQHGIFLDSCERHCSGYDVEINGTKKTEALKLWYEREIRQSIREVDVYVQGEEYYCETCCNASLLRTPSSAPNNGNSLPTSVPSMLPSVGPAHEPMGLASSVRHASGGTHSLHWRNNGILLAFFLLVDAIALLH